jgi:hypothetical protein
MSPPKDPEKRKEWKEKMRGLAVERFKDPEFRRKQKEGVQKSTRSPEWKRRQQDGVDKRGKDPEYRRKQREGSQKNSQDPEWIRKNKEHLQKLTQDPEWISKNKISMQKIAQDPEARLKRLETLLGGFWYGNVDNDPNPIYHEDWEDVNILVHTFFKNECCLCHAPENGRSHIGHHVFYVKDHEKDSCCSISEDGIYYTNLNARDHPEHDYCIGENPNYFVILCRRCHGRTNGKFANRKKWADYFREMIDEEYGGACYILEE